LKRQAAEVVIAGVICLDVIPQIEQHSSSAAVKLSEWFVPGKLINIGSAVTASGGAVPNTGLALHRLGVPVRLAGKIGDDLFGRALAGILDAEQSELSADLIVSPDAMTSYTLVISPPGVDRIFMHCSGANDTFSGDELNYEQIASARLFHFGYPPLMRRMYEDGGRELSEMFRRIKELGVTTSLDMAKPDPDSPAGQVDWRSLLTLVLPYVDVFLPSYEELLFMLDRESYDRLERESGAGLAFSDATLQSLSVLADQLLGLGAAIVGIKLGEHGLYVKTTPDAARMANIGACSRDDGSRAWSGLEMLAPCYMVDVAGTTGAGDCTIAGFLTGLLRGLPMEQIILGAVAVGAFNVERPDATSGVPAWEEVERRRASGWTLRDNSWILKKSDWERDISNGLYYRSKRG
jgi:sugar/nucleoside kinase (ribokinase family)